MRMRFVSIDLVHPASASDEHKAVKFACGTAKSGSADLRAAVFFGEISFDGIRGITIRDMAVGQASSWAK